MSYQTITTALLTLVRAYSGGTVFTTANSAEDDWTVLNENTIAAVVHMAGDSAEGDLLDGRGAQGKRQARHEVGLTVAQPIGTDKDSVALAALHAMCDALMAYLRSYARLSGASGVKRAEVMTRTRARVIGPSQEMGTHWISTIVVRVYEELAVSYASGDSPS